MTNPEDDIKRLINRSSLGSKAARKLRNSVSHEHAQRVQEEAQAVQGRETSNSRPVTPPMPDIPRSAEFIDRLEQRANRGRGRDRDDRAAALYTFIDQKSDTSWLRTIALAPDTDDPRFVALLKNCKSMSRHEQQVWTELARQVRQSDLKRAKLGDGEARKVVAAEADLIFGPLFNQILGYEEAELPFSIFKWKFLEIFDAGFDPFLDFRHWVEDTAQRFCKEQYGRRRRD